jgi:hypothetical protein
MYSCIRLCRPDQCCDRVIGDSVKVKVRRSTTNRRQSVPTPASQPKQRRKQQQQQQQQPAHVPVLQVPQITLPSSSILISPLIQALPSSSLVDIPNIRAPILESVPAIVVTQSPLTLSQQPADIVKPEHLTSSTVVDDEVNNSVDAAPLFPTSAPLPTSTFSRTTDQRGPARKARRHSYYDDDHQPELVKEEKDVVADDPPIIDTQSPMTTMVSRVDIPLSPERRRRMPVSFGNNHRLASLLMRPLTSLTYSIDESNIFRTTIRRVLPWFCQTLINYSPSPPAIDRWHKKLHEAQAIQLCVSCSSPYRPCSRCSAIIHQNNRHITSDIMSTSDNRIQQITSSQSSTNSLAPSSSSDDVPNAHLAGSFLLSLWKPKSKFISFHSSILIRSCLNNTCHDRCDNGGIICPRSYAYCGLLLDS